MKKKPFNLTRLYTPENVKYIHIALWCILLMMYTLNIMFLYSTNLRLSLMFALRNLLGAMFFFYFIFYLLVPEFLRKNQRVLFFIGLLVPFWAWAVINYSFMTVLLKYFTIKDKELLASVKVIADKPFGQIMAPQSVVQTAIGVLMIVSPPIIIKLVMEISISATRTLRLERDNLNLEVSFLRSQLNPHFLFNTLNNIYSLSVRNNPRAPVLIMQLSDMLRYTLYESNQEKVDLSKEADFLYNYVELERARYGKDVDIQFLYDPESLKGYKIVPLLTFPFIENSFKHGLATTTANPWLKITFQVADNTLYFEIANSKGDEKLFKHNHESGTGGIGIANTRKRLSLLYQDKHTLSINNSPDSHSINLNIILT
ncbi:MAG TPA: histidine kinase [Chitinophaga sp.]|uniref:sensor histidine kinase n=1 Tax=Chitinophaga sp. TaxID=1869181 RepID=UPI002DB96B24|nr:histidine kinase [Chitinophaga sp.]HEU4552185.1 histidine kinase [Chitinophaga sp.]